MRRLKKDTYEWLREYAAHYSNKDFGLLVQQIESVPPMPFCCVPIISSRNDQYSESTVVAIPGDAFEEVSLSENR